ncbi:MAG: MFS transporter [Methyloligellaceae bacterium]
MSMSATETASSKPDSLAVKSWILFDWAGQPFYTLVATFLFAPYFVEHFIGDQVKGQAYWLYASGCAGLIIAFLSPVLGSISDATGRRKPWILLFVAIQTVAMCMLWYAKPGDMSAFWIVILGFVIATVCAEFVIVFTNSMMPDLVHKDDMGKLSGTAYAVGYLGGVVALVIMSGFIIAANIETGKTVLGLDPIINLDASQREGDRFSGPFSAIWLVVFSLPFFLFTPDGKGKKVALGKAISSGLSELSSTFHSLRNYRNIMVFLIARLLYVDGLAAILYVGAIYASSLFSWGTLEQGLFGIFLAVTGTLGAFLGGRFDDIIGPKKVIMLGLIGLLVATIGIISVDKTHILFVIEVAEKTKGSAPFSSVAEQVYLGFAFLIGIVFGPIYSSSRTLMARLAPEDKRTEFFGFFAFSGKVTSFMAPVLIAFITEFSQSQRIGIATTIVFITAGFILMMMVRQEQKS